MNKDEQAKKIREYLKQHPCLDYSAKLLLEETAKFLEDEALEDFNRQCERDEQD